MLSSLTPCLTTRSRLTLLVVTTPGRANLSPASKLCPHHGTIQVGKTHGRSVFITWTCTSLSKGGLFSSNWTCTALYKEGLLVLLGPARHYTKIRFYYLDMNVIIQGRPVFYYLDMHVIIQGRPVFINRTCTSLYKGVLFLLLGPARHYTRAICFYFLDLHVICIHRDSIRDATHAD